MSRAIVTIRGENDRVRAAKWIGAVPYGTRVEFKEARRTLEQNDRMWAMLTDVASQLKWHGQHLKTGDWKLIFLDALNRETRAVPDLYGIGFVSLGRSSSDLSKDEMSQLMELIAAFGAEHGVKFNDGLEEPPPKMTRAEVLAKARAVKAQRKAAGGPRGRPPAQAVEDTPLVPEATSEAPPAAEARPLERIPTTEHEYVEYAKAMIGVAPAPERWFLSETEVALRENCKVADLTVQLLHSLAAQAG